MKTTTRRHRRSEREWTRLVEEWRRSDLSAGEYAEKHDLGRMTLLRWAAKLTRSTGGRGRRNRRSARRIRGATRFVPVQLSPEVPKAVGRQERFQGSIELELADGGLVRLRGEVSSVALAVVLAAMERAKSC